MDTKVCTSCQRRKPLSAFTTDRHAYQGVRNPCRTCGAAKRAAKRAVGAEPPPGALVLVMPPRPVPVPDAPPPLPPGSLAAGPPPVDADPADYHYREEAAKFIRALSPPASDADALLVHMLRDLARLADNVRRIGSSDPVRETNQLVASMLRVQRELAGTRAAKASDSKPAEVARSKFESFRDAQ